MRDVYVLGTGQTFFGKQPELTSIDLAALAAHRAIVDAAIDPKDIQRGFAGSVYSDPNVVQCALSRNGIDSIPSYTVENACTSGTSAVDLLFRDIALGGTEVGIAIGVESLSTFNKRRVGGKGLLTTAGDIHGEQGMSTVSYFAGLANLLKERYGATDEDLTYAAVKNHKNAAENPYAQYKKPLSHEDIMASAMIVEPITALMCCPQSDGAAAVILCSKEYYEAHKKEGRPAVRVAASVISSSGVEDQSFDQLEMENLMNGAKQAYEMAGITADDLDVVELHDAFSSEELASYMMLGLADKEHLLEAVHNGDFEVGGRCPVNPSGGLLSMGHPLGASGVRVVADVARQLWGEFTPNQIEGAKVGMAEMLGGLLGTIRTSPIAGIQILIRD